MQVLESVTPPDLKHTANTTSSALYSSTNLSQLQTPYSIQGDVCNGLLPTKSTAERFQWFVDYLAANDFYVCLVHRTNEEHITAVSPESPVHSPLLIPSGLCFQNCVP